MSLFEILSTAKQHNVVTHDHTNTRHQTSNMTEFPFLVRCSSPRKISQTWHRHVTSLRPVTQIILKQVICSHAGTERLGTCATTKKHDRYVWPWCCRLLVPLQLHKAASFTRNRYLNYKIWHIFRIMTQIKHYSWNDLYFKTRLKALCTVPPYRTLSDDVSRLRSLVGFVFQLKWSASW